MAPVLALLDDIPGVAVSRIDWTGMDFLLELEQQAQVDAILAQADGVLGHDTRRLDSAAEQRAIASYRAGKPWLRASETFELSLEEARILAERHVRRAAETAGLSATETDRFVAALRTEIASAFEDIHRAGQGLPDRFDVIFQRVLERTLHESRAFLSAVQIERLQRAILDQVGGS